MTPATRDLSIPTLLFLDTETSGFYMEDKTPFDAAQPWIMQCAAALCNDAGVMVNSFNLLIKADGRTAKENAVKIHGVSAWATSQVGVPEPRFLGLLSDMLKTVPMTAMKVITYGDFDKRVVSSLFSRFGAADGRPNAYDRLWAARPGTEFINLMAPWCQQACKLPPNFEGADYGWPSLDKAVEIVLGRPPREGHHDAWEDMLLLRDLYFHFQQRGMFPARVAA